jgi:hypothetical protein
VVEIVDHEAPSSDRSIRNPSSLPELSLHLTITVLLLLGTPFVSEGALGAGGGGVVAQEMFENSEYAVLLPEVR